MQEYEDLGHMERVDIIETPHYYLPHHPVFKPDSSSTKLRVVFDGSAKTSTKVSLNDMLLAGPVVQNELFTILIRFRAHAYVFSADIAKMYRQIQLHQDDQKYHYIYWRHNSNSKLETFRLKTVTYGTTSAPFLATRCLLELALIYQNDQPLASAAIKNDTYVDDLLTGSNSLDELLHLKVSIAKILQSAGMILRKWCSNKPVILNDIPIEDKEQFLEIENHQYIKTLGMYWQADCDHFRIQIGSVAADTKITKRNVISEIATIFDPIGLVSPIVVMGKMFMQTLWQLKVNWDESLPMMYHTHWDKFRKDILELKNLFIPRHLFNGAPNPTNIQLHGFADASEKAFGAAIYVRFQTENGYSAQLLCSKSRVAPLKKQTLPRLELCASQLLAKLMDRIKKEVNFMFENVFYWTDSTITLHWIKSPPSRWQTFVANRVANIQAVSNSDNWFHVRSNSNPADLVSRGCLPKDLITSKLWWSGPTFLHTAIECWSSVSDDAVIIQGYDQDLYEIRKSTLNVTIEANDGLLDRIHCKNSYKRVIHTMAYILRFSTNCRNKNEKLSGPLSTAEINKGLNICLVLVQLQCFPTEYQGLQKKNYKVKNGSLKSLSLFMDENKLLRVGGRLQFSALSYSARHPILLPNNHYFTITLLTYLHNKHLHVGPQALLAAARQNYWPISGKQLVKRVYRNCIICSRHRAKLQQQMAALPVERVTPAPPFYHVGIDFAGPFFVHYKIRGKIPTKTYLAVFICFATKAIHLELASDLSTAAFIGAFRRFVSTRGLCKKVFSDNGTNFVGANSELNELYKMLQGAEMKEKISTLCQDNQIIWKFSPPGSPHFGGIYEGAVKSAKFHLRRMMGNAHLTYEELNTLIKQVEAVLNSRPIISITSDDTIDVLTPGHFLIGRPLTAIPEHNVNIQHNVNYLKRWELVNHIYKQFWTRWSKEYLQQLQHRYYWQKKTNNVMEGTIVLIKDDNLPPLNWKLGQIIALHPGKDGIVRVVTIKTSTGTLKRAITQISPLPTDIEQSSTGGE